MDAALKSTVVPHLRSLGFKGARPNFRRVRGGAVDLLEFQFNRYGGSFAVNMARVPQQGITYDGIPIPVERCRTWYMRDRHRLGSGLGMRRGDHWFDFTRHSPEDIAQQVCAELDRRQLWAFIDRLGMRPEL